MQSFERFAKEEDGAVTVDWVVLTSAVVGLGIAVMLAIGGATSDLADSISGAIATASVWSY